MMQFSIFIYFVIIVQLLSALKGSFDAISCFPFSLECYKLFCLDKIPEVAKTSLKTKEIFFIKVKTPP